MNSLSSPEQGRNIGEEGINFRYFFGGLLIFFALGMTLLLAVMGAPLFLRALVFFPLWFGVLCLIQAGKGVCVFLAAKGQCVVAHGTIPIANPAARQALEQQAIRIHIISMVVACLLAVTLMLASLLIPWQSFFTTA
ncbi:MAG: hypothetical protein HOM68_17410 [Gemmatimonadetes bacterium]|nr:hypothetical protein [Gemmatimonadota bacterium]MBT5141465.1 hypothetical protein [Gemmatimonadota bacterium]MBT5590698.1 hypothetical protein [Gemmatimonadota bacterium]MBT5965167.1 hypothetical protein [Gemmatimonadota bacterium]MBT6625848.1 hypothetical protein [Gemmatimonadota bacterium]